MITETGYSKDPSIRPEAIAITFGKQMMESNGGKKAMMEHFLKTMQDENAYWMHKMMLWPTVEFCDVYIITLNRLWGKVKFGWYEKSATFAYKPDGTDKLVEWPRIVLVGPFVRCPFKRELKGFQGFRYCTKLF
jgi:hypothetical protein